ncbi:SDR family NAD(P)-dependent oxidoreductase [Chelativorans xinjiangense]|uniref:SDR family NAD(P)-dependent oxidoreductase n=1 Tax=Chelativorans xinjiangense TaxID=2681485 RepID=UPI001359886D|nr:SDR family NAD(P)-dependent oxidoreductase [Chelativorans xinjiangense]
MDSGLSGKVALVTGSSRSIGAEIVRALARDGADVVVNVRTAGGEAEAVAEECRGAGVRATVVVADVSSDEGTKALAAGALDAFGRVDILVNNVGASPRMPFLDMAYEDWSTLFDINANSMFRMCKLIVPQMVERGWGRIINMGGHAHINIHGTGVHVKATKAAVVGLTRGLAGELAQHGITANVVAPHAIDTPPRHNKYYRDNDPKWDPVSRGVDKIPVGRLGKPAEIAALIRFLCSDDAAYLTGQTYLVNGGIAAG